MGACVKPANLEDTSTLIYSSSIQNDFQFHISLITKSYFYYLLRKEIYDRLKNVNSINTQFIDVRDSNQFEGNHTFIANNLTKAENLDATSKILYDFRNIIIVDEQQKSIRYKLSERIFNLVKKIKDLNIKPSKILILRSPISQFLKQYNFFAERSKIQSLEKSLLAKNNIPILCFSSQQVIPKPNKKVKIYLQLNKFYEKNIKNDARFYDSYFQVKDKIKISVNQSTNQQEINADLQKKLIKLRRDLIQNKSDSVIVLTSHLIYHDVIIKQILRYVCQMFYINYAHGLQYFIEKFPGLNQKITQQEKKNTIWKDQQIQYQKKPQNMLKNEELLHYFIKYHKQTGKKQPFTEKAFNLLVMLLDNLTKNADPQQFRNIKTTNKQLGQYLFKYNYGKKLLQAIGFYQQKGINMYRNDLEQKYLKNYQIDLALAYKNFQTNDSVN